MSEGIERSYRAQRLERKRTWIQPFEKGAGAEPEGREYKVQDSVTTRQGEP